MTHKIAILGLGIMGRRLLAQLGQHASFQVTAIWDPAEASCAKARE